MTSGASRRDLRHTSLKRMTNVSPRTAVSRRATIKGIAEDPITTGLNPTIDWLEGGGRTIRTTMLASLLIGWTTRETGRREMMRMRASTMELMTTLTPGITMSMDPGLTRSLKLLMQPLLDTRMEVLEMQATLDAMRSGMELLLLLMRGGSEMVAHGIRGDALDGTTGSVEFT